jgi:predicted ArsR family transcriptional regulator
VLHAVSVTNDNRLGMRVLALLERDGPLGYGEVATRLDEPPDAVRASLTRLRDLGFVDAVAVGELEAHLTRAAAQWRLTDAGREKLAHLRAAGRPASI